MAIFISEQKEFWTLRSTRIQIFEFREITWKEFYLQVYLDVSKHVQIISLIVEEARKVVKTEQTA
jgi:hypothetical protein